MLCAKLKNLLGCCGLLLCLICNAADAPTAGSQPLPSGKKILWVDSYSLDYPWSSGTLAGLQSALSGSGVTLEKVHMDTKEKRTSQSLEAAGLLVVKKVQSFKPDLIVASDDPAQAFAVLPHLLDKKIPIVFTGVNWDASPYGYPRQGVTGMVEVDQMDVLIRHMSSMARGKRYAIISADDITEKKNVAHNQRQSDVLKGNQTAVFVKSYKEFQQRFLALQTTADAIIVSNVTTVADWDKINAKKWIHDHTRVVTGTTNEWMADLVLISVSRVPEEQGVHAGKTALRILSGEKPESIPLVTNVEAVLRLNQPLSTKMGLLFPTPLLRAASRAPQP